MTAGGSAYESAYSSMQSMEKSPKIDERGRIPNYFGFWGQDLNAYFLNPSLSILAAKKQMGYTEEENLPLLACPGLYKPSSNDIENRQFRNPVPNKIRGNLVGVF
jgi:hypothetical protein